MRRFLCGSGGYNRDDTSGHVVTWDTHARVRLSAPNSTTSAAPPEFVVHTVTRAHIPAHGAARGRQPRFACTSRRALRQRTDSNVVHAASDTQWLSLLERPAFVRTHGGRCPVALREAPDGFQRLGRRTSARSRGPVYDSATTRHSQARMCSSVCTHPFMAPPSPHMART